MGVKINEDMKIVDPAVLFYNMDVNITGTTRETEGLCSENLNMTVAVQDLNLTVAVQNRNGTADLDNMNCNMEVHSLASSTLTREDCPHMDDYDQTLKELGEWHPFGVHVDQPV